MFQNRSVFGALAVIALAIYPCAGFSQVDLSGSWNKIVQQNFVAGLEGPFPADFTGIPLNEDGRAASLSFNPESLEQLQRECEPWPVHYLFWGPQGFRATIQRDPMSAEVIGIHFEAIIDRMAMAIWLDGRQAPPAQALHTFAGFTTGKWRGATLVTTTTHIKDSFLTRNGVPNSSQEKITAFITRHGNLLTITAIVQDPVYLTTAYPWVETFRLIDSGADSFQLDAHGMRCLPEETIEGLSDGYHTVSNLPGKNELIDFMSKNYGIPVEASLGGEQTMLPSYQKTLHKIYKSPAGYCGLYCCGAASGEADAGLRRPPNGCKGVSP